MRVFFLLLYWCKIRKCHVNVYIDTVTKNNENGDGKSGSEIFRRVERIEIALSLVFR